MRKKRILFIAPLAFVGMALVIWIGGELVMHLWNWNLPAVFGWREITFWQALGLFALCRILFGGTGPIRRTSSNSRQRIRERMAERWEKMTPEEREKYRQSWRGRCSPFKPPSDTNPSA